MSSSAASSAYWSAWTCANSWCTWFWMPYFLDFLTREKSRADTAGTHLWWGNGLYFTAALILPVGFQIGQFLGYPMWGRAVDRFGRKPVFFVSSTLHTLTWLCWIFLFFTHDAALDAPRSRSPAASSAAAWDIASFNTSSTSIRLGAVRATSVLATVIFSVAGAISACCAGALATALTGCTWTFAPGTAWEHTFNHYALMILIGAAIKYTGPTCSFSQECTIWRGQAFRQATPSASSRRISMARWIRSSSSPSEAARRSRRLGPAPLLEIASTAELHRTPPGPDISPTLTRGPLIRRNYHAWPGFSQRMRPAIMVVLAQLVRVHRVVVPRVAGSNPVHHPFFSHAVDFGERLRGPRAGPHSRRFRLLPEQR